MSSAGAVSNRAAWCRGTSHTSKGAREAYGASATQVGVVRHDPRAGGQFLRHEVAEHAVAGRGMVPLGAPHFLVDARRHPRHGHDLRVRVRQAGAGLGAVILEGQGGLHAAVAAQVGDAVAPRQQHGAKIGGGHRVPRRVVARRFHHHFVGAQARLVFEQAVAHGVAAGLHPQHRHAVGHHAQLPARGCLRGCRRARPESRARPRARGPRTADTAGRSRADARRGRSRADAPARRRPQSPTAPLPGRLATRTSDHRTTGWAVTSPGGTRSGRSPAPAPHRARMVTATTSKRAGARVRPWRAR